MFSSTEWCVEPYPLHAYDVEKNSKKTESF